MLSYYSRQIGHLSAFLDSLALRELRIFFIRRVILPYFMLFSFFVKLFSPLFLFIDYLIVSI